MTFECVYWGSVISSAIVFLPAMIFAFFTGFLIGKSNER